jgi:hypothetical protein
MANDKPHLLKQVRFFNVESRYFNIKATLSRKVVKTESSPISSVFFHLLTSDIVLNSVLGMENIYPIASI